MPIAQRFDGSLHNMLRRFEVRLTDAEIDDLFAFALQLRGARQDFECGLRTETV